MKTDKLFGKFVHLTLLVLPFGLMSCAHTKSTPVSSIGPARAAVNESIVNAPDGSMSDPVVLKELTRSQKVVYRTNYIDFHATLLPFELGKKVCFEFRIETDDDNAREALKWDAHLKREGHDPVRVNFENFIAVPTNKYPLVFNAKGCADDIFETRYPIYLVVNANFRPNIDPIRLEWYLQK